MSTVLRIAQPQRRCELLLCAACTDEALEKERQGQTLVNFPASLERGKKVLLLFYQSHEERLSKVPKL